MTIAERNNKLRHFITCLKCEVNGKCCDVNCSTQYEAGTMGEIIENLEAISKALDQEPTAKNDLGVDAISRKSVIAIIQNHWWNCRDIDKLVNELPSVTPQLSSGLEKNSKKLEKNFGELDCISREQALKELKESAEHHVNDSREEVLLRRDRDIIRALPSVTPQEPQTFKWCDTCKEYDQEKHCCHRWSKVIRDTVDEMKQEQEPILDKIRAEIDNALSDGMVHKKTVLGIIDKYKAESEDNK